MTPYIETTPTPPRYHRLKTDQRFFRAVAFGDKTAELRRDDRGFAVGDMLVLTEISEAGERTGALVMAEITHILRDADGPWLAPGYCMLSFKKRRGLPPPEEGK